MNRLLGKAPATFSKKTLKMANYIDEAKLPPLPDEVDHYSKLSKMTMAANDTYGCCVVSGCAHIIQVWSSIAGREVILSDQTVIDTYLKLTGGQDIGLNVLSFLTYWSKNPIAGHPLGPFMSIDPTNDLHMKYGIHLFGAVFTGIELPETAQDQAVWDYPACGEMGRGGVGSWGGHLTINAAYDKQNDLINYTWGEKLPMTKKFRDTYVDEGFTAVSLDWFTKDHKTIDGFAWKDLLSDLQKIKS